MTEEGKRLSAIAIVGKLNRSSTRQTAIEENSISNIVFGSIGVSVVTVGSFMTLINQAWAPDALKVWQPFGYYLGMLVILIGASFIEMKRADVAKERRESAMDERDLRAMGVEMRWSYIDGEGTDLEPDTPAVTSVGVTLVFVWGVWAVTAVVRVFGVLPLRAALVAFVSAIVVAILGAVVRNAVRPRNQKLRFGALVWTALGILTLVGVIGTALFLHGKAIGIDLAALVKLI